MNRATKDLPAARKANEAARERKWASHAADNGGKHQLIDRGTAIELLEYNQDTGHFFWKVSPGRRAKAGSLAGTIDRKGYRRIAVRGHIYKAHRLAWLYVYGIWPGEDIDHINGNRDDNRIANLRDVSRSENLQNQRVAMATSKSGLLGASFDSTNGAWRSQIRTDGVYKFIGYFATAEEAHRAYVEEKRLAHTTCSI